MQDIKAISYAWTSAVAVILKGLFFTKWESNPDPIVLSVTQHIKTEWCNERLGNSSGHAHNCVINTNGLEGTNNVIKDELTYRQLLPVMEFMQKGLVWVREQSERRSDGPNGEPNLNKVVFAKSHTFTTGEWTAANAWKKNTSKQIRFVPRLNVYVAIAAGVKGDLTDEKAHAYAVKFRDGAWGTFDEFTSMYFNVCILYHDLTEYGCTCSKNAKEFTCVHSIGVAMMRNTLVPPQAAQVQLLGRKRRRGRKPLAAPAWEMMQFAIDTPPQHPQQDDAILLGQPVAQHEAVGEDLAADLVVE